MRISEHFHFRLLLCFLTEELCLDGFKSIQFKSVRERDKSCSRMSTNLLIRFSIESFSIEKSNPIQKQLFVTLEEDEQLIYDYLLKSGKELLDIIALECDFPIYKISCILLNMELKGVIRPLPGKLFEAI